MLRITSLVIILFGLSLQISAQCSVNFKESNRQLFSDSFADSHFEDFDGDGLKDLLGYSITQLGNPGPDNYQLRYYKRLSDNSFDTNAKSTTITNVAGYSQFGIVGDVNGDGKKDLIIQHFTEPLTSVTYLNDGTGAFSTTTPATSAPSGGEIVWAASDLNNDGKDDIITTSDAGLGYRLTQSDNTFGETVAIGVATNMQYGRNLFGPVSYVYVKSYPLVVEDLNNDGLKDIAFVNMTGAWSHELRVLTNTGNLNFTNSGSTPFSHVVTKLKTYDFNNDGKKDFVANRSQNEAARVVINNGDNSFANTILPLPGQITNLYGQHYAAKDYFVSDFDNDGDLDIIYAGLGFHALAKNQGNQTFVSEQMRTPYKIDDIVNLDNDGKGDVLSLVNPLLDGAYRISVESNFSYYQLQNAVSFRNNVCTPAGQTKIVDFDGDGTTDIASWNPTNGNWRYYKNNIINASNQVNFQFGLGSLGDVPVANDYDGDGKTDYAVFRKSNGTWWMSRSSDQGYTAVQFGISEDKPVPADYDGDGKADVAVFRPSTGEWHFLMSETGQYAVAQFGISEDIPVPADFDGDGRADINVYRPSTGVWYRYNSSDQTVFIVKYGVSTDKPIPADYDGDGKANIAVYRDGLSYVLRDDFTTSLIYWGIAEDIPFFNDGTTSWFGVYRKSEAKVYGASASSFVAGYLFGQYNTGFSETEIFVSSILPPE